MLQNDLASKSHFKYSRKKNLERGNIPTYTQAYELN